MALQKITLRELLRRAASDINLISDNESLPQDLTKSCFDLANDVVSEMNNDEVLFPFKKFVEIFLDDTNSSENILIERPTAGIEYVSYKNPPAPPFKLNEMSLSEFMDVKDYDSLAMPVKFFYNGEYPYSELTIYPRINYGSLIIVQSGEFSHFISLDEELEFPDGWILFLKMQIAVRLAQKYNLAISQDYIDKSTQIKSKLIRSSSANEVYYMSSDYNQASNYCSDIRTLDYRGGRR